MIMAGAAAGLAAAFNTPLGGIVFAVEELTKTHFGYFKTALFTSVIIAGLTSQGLLGPYLYIGYPDVSNLSNWMFLVVIVVAVITGMLSAVTSKIILVVMKWKATFTKQNFFLLYVLVAGFAIASIGFFINSDVLGSGKNLMTGILFSDNKYLLWYIPFLKTIGLILSYTAGAAGGVFAPSLSVGAGIGSFISGILHLNATDSNLLILCGMVGFLTGVTRTPFTSAILVLEMTDKHGVIFQLLLAGMFANFAALTIDRHSFYDLLKHQYLHDVHRISEPVTEMVEKRIHETP
jgi:H+/Cl- antiporter ClcA